MIKCGSPCASGINPLVRTAMSGYACVPVSIVKGEIVKRLPESELLMGLKEELDILKAKEGK